MLSVGFDTAALNLLSSSSKALVPGSIFLQERCREEGTKVRHPTVNKDHKGDAPPEVSPFFPSPESAILLQDLGSSS